MTGAVAAQLVVDLDITAEECLRYYGGAAISVLARARDGRLIRFPASALRDFVTEHGVQGTFELQCDANGRLIAMARWPVP